MASSNTIEPWMFRSDSWYPDSFARETESALTKALQQSFFNNQNQSDLTNPISSSFLLDYSNTTASASTVTASGSGSEPETPGSRPRSLGVTIGKPTKRKSRASKRSMTTFIQADPSNFRQMVQQVTGVKFEGLGQVPVVKPEPMRQPYINKLQGLLPTLDTSAYLLHHQNSNTRRIPVSGSISASTGFSQLPPVHQLPVDGGAGVDFYASFPTLESSF